MARVDDLDMDKVCAWIRIELEVLLETAQRDYGIDSLESAAVTDRRTRQYLSALGEVGDDIFKEYTDVTRAGDLDKFAEADRRLATFLLAERWGMMDELRERGATDFEDVARQTYTRLFGMFGEANTDRIFTEAMAFYDAASGT